jgi:hypothetical protein
LEGPSPSGIDPQEDTPVHLEVEKALKTIVDISIPIFRTDGCIGDILSQSTVMIASIPISNLL